jgi:hypothetical protein
MGCNDSAKAFLVPNKALLGHTLTNPIAPHPRSASRYGNGKGSTVVWHCPQAPSKGIRGVSGDELAA